MGNQVDICLVFLWHCQILLIGILINCP